MQLSARGLPADHRVNVGVGLWRSEYSVVQEARTDREGRLVTPVQMPDWADPGDRLVFVVETPDHDLKVMTDPIIVIRRDERPDEPRPDLEAGQRVRITGTLTDEGVECQALRSESGELYTLVGNLEGFHMGQEVYMEGTEVEVSVCQQGTTLEVRVIRERGPRPGR